jgi:hypothetical protein
MLLRESFTARDVCYSDADGYEVVIYSDKEECERTMSSGKYGCEKIIYTERK